MPLFERHSNYNATGVTRYRHFVPLPGGASVLYTQYSNQVATTYYLHKDQLGSTTAASTSAGGLYDRISYDPFGRVRNLDGSDRSSAYIPPGRRGFTGHEMLGEVDYIHMALGQPLNGRIYDGKLGRFVSADFIIPDPQNSQSFNRYSYVDNNPLSMTDPNGQCGPCIFKTLKRSTLREPALWLSLRATKLRELVCRQSTQNGERRLRKLRAGRMPSTFSREF